MTAAESRYQTLRSHLHYLRLEAAAEALPQKLERAHKEKLSHTAFLERLLAIEVEATEARRLARLRGTTGWRVGTRRARGSSSVSRRKAPGSQLERLHGRRCPLGADVDPHLGGPRGRPPLDKAQVRHSLVAGHGA